MSKTIFLNCVKEILIKFYKETTPWLKVVYKSESEVEGYIKSQGYDDPKIKLIASALFTSNSLEEALEKISRPAQHPPTSVQKSTTHPSISSTISQTRISVKVTFLTREASALADGVHNLRRYIAKTIIKRGKKVGVQKVFENIIVKEKEDKDKPIFSETFEYKILPSEIMVTINIADSTGFEWKSNLSSKVKKFQEAN